MPSRVIETHREKAEVYYGAKACKRKSGELLEEIGLPRGILPLDDVVEVGYDKSRGFVWLKQKKASQHRFPGIGKTVSYDSHITAFIESRRMRRLTGVRSKELLIWVSLNEICVAGDNSSTSGDMITFKTPSGISRSFPASAFEVTKGI